MKYNVVTDTGSQSIAGIYHVNARDEVTYIAWKLEQRQLTYGLGWRELCRATGVVDPMQVARPLGQDERFLLGERLRIGQALAIS